MNKAEEVESVKIANPEIKTSHPFEDKYFLEVIKKYAPEYIDRLKDTARPGISDNPDELESWEAGQIGRRKKQLPYESDYGYAVRVLYEETFSVNQFPKKPFKESNGLTVG